MSDEEDCPLYAIVLFLPRKTDELDDIDMVPYSWIVKKNDGLYCRFPDPHEYDKINDWLESLQQPNRKWSVFPIEIVCSAYTLEQGKRRLERAKKTAEAESTDCDKPDETSKNTVQIFRGKSLKNQLADVQPMPKKPQTKSAGDSIQKCVQTQKTTLISAPNHDSASSKNTLPLSTLEIIRNELKQHSEAINKKIDSMKASISYDLEKKFDSLKKYLVAHQSGNIPVTNLSTVSREFKGILPADDWERFKSFDDSLATTEAKDKLKNYYRVLCFGETDLTNCIGKTMSETITKNVQLLYSGSGKRIHGSVKKDFSSTNTFTCLQDIILEKFGDAEESKKFSGRIGKWLAGAKDRSGGRKERGGPSKK